MNSETNPLYAEIDRLRAALAAAEAKCDGANCVSRETLMATEAERDVVLEAARELLEVADLRGDTELPHPEDDEKPWTARMQTAWDDLRVIMEEHQP